MPNPLPMKNDRHVGECSRGYCRASSSNRGSNCRNERNLTNWRRTTRKILARYFEAGIADNLLYLQRILIRCRQCSEIVIQPADWPSRSIGQNEHPRLFLHVFIPEYAAWQLRDITSSARREPAVLTVNNDKRVIGAARDNQRSAQAPVELGRNVDD